MIKQDDQSPMWSIRCDHCSHEQELTDNPDDDYAEALCIAKGEGWQVRTNVNAVRIHACPACMKLSIIAGTLLDHYSGSVIDAVEAARDVLKRLE